LIRPIAAVLIAAAALSGCKSQGPERAMARFYGEDAVRATAPATAPDARSETANGPDAPDTAPEPQLAARPDPAAPPPEVDATPERFLGAAPEALGAELGRPALVRAEGPARVWQYRGQACVLDLVLYPGTDGPTVRHLEARDPVDAQPRDTAACLKDLLQRRALAATG
jgi:hypothetical protein